MGLVASGTPMIKWTDYFHDENKGYRLLYAKDGVAASVSILERKDGIREINLDGKSTAYTNYSDIQVHQYLGHLPLMLLPSRTPAKVLIVGFGLGSTCWSCLQHDVEFVECVELVKEEQETAKYFEEENHDVVSHPKFRLMIGDGRNYLLATDQMYDVISLNAIHPKFSPSLYTSDFYELVQARLSDDGIVCAWITLDGLTEQEFKMLLRSYWEVFP
jgi:spermidine synthase